MSETSQNKTTPAFGSSMKPEHQSIIDELVELQKLSVNKRGNPKSDEEFAKPLGFSGPKWNMLRNGQYSDKVKDFDKVMTGLRQSLNRLRTTHAIAMRHAPNEFYPFPQFESVFSAVEECLEKKLSENRRFVVYLAETGGGKSALGYELVKRFEGAVVCEARDRWVNSKLVALRDICERMGVDPGKISDPSIYEDELLKFLQGDQRVVAIDEGEFFGAGILNSIKRILNQSRTVFVCCAIPSAYMKWNKRFPHEAVQIQRRTHGVFGPELVTPKEAERFLSALDLNGSLKDASIKLAKAANTFGSFGLCREVVNRLHDEKKLNAEDVEQAIIKEQAAFGLGLQTTKK